MFKGRKIEKNQLFTNYMNLYLEKSISRKINCHYPVRRKTYIQEVEIPHLGIKQQKTPVHVPGKRMQEFLVAFPVLVTQI